jgi:phosphoglycerol geranylgeranyltransferase
MAAERHLESELVYLEYSGTYGGDEAVEILESVSDALSWSRLWYGGGLDSRERAEAVLDAGADAVVVGDVFHRIADEEAALCEQASRELDTDANLTSDAGARPDAEVPPDADARPDADDAREWVRENAAVADSAAATYLATNPSVADPERLAERYLTATVRTWLVLQGLSEDVEADESRGVPSASEVVDSALNAEASNALRDGDAELVGRCLHALLVGGDAAADEEAGTVSADHFAASLHPR